MPEHVYKADTVIVGGGLAGISAALELLDHGLRVLILDRDEENAFGGLARWSFGGIFLVDSKEQRRGGIKDSPALAYGDWVRTGELEDTDDLTRDWARAYVEDCSSDVDAWLRDRSIRFFPVVHWVERGMYEPGNLVPRFHMVWGTGYRLIEILTERLRTHPQASLLNARFRHRVDGLDVAGGRVSGVHGKVEPGGAEFRVEADAVVIAAGGYCGSEDWLRTHWDADLGAAPDVILNGSHRYATGSMHIATESAGGEIVHPERAWLYAAGVHHPSPRHPNHGLSIVPPKSALWLNIYGERIGPPPLVSGFDTRYLVSAVCHSPGGYSWQVMNWRIACKELAVSGSEYNDAIRDRKILAFIRATLFGNKSLMLRLSRECDDIVVADSVEELAARMNDLTGSGDIDPVSLRETLEEYDGCVGSLGNDDQLRRIAHMRRYRGDRARTCRSQQILDPAAMPLVAIREFILSRKSLGGIRTDLGSRVLVRRVTADGSEAAEGDLVDEADAVDMAGAGRSAGVIAGLYAVGEAAGFGGGGIHGKRSLEGTFLGTCIYTGRVAARTIAGGG